MFTSGKAIAAQDVREISAVQKEALGSVGVTRDGRVYVYGQAGASDITRGQLAVAEAVVANHTNQTFAASAVVGADEVTLNLGATAVTADQYADGYLVCNDAAGEGVLYQIISNSSASASGVVRAKLYEPLVAALTVSVSEGSLIKNPAKTVITSTTLSKAVGVANTTITAAYFGWFQSGGIAAVLADGTPAKGTNVVQSNGTAGSVEAMTDSTTLATDIQELIGITLETAVSTEHRAVFLKISC